MKVLKIDVGSEDFEVVEDDSFGAISSSLNHHFRNETYKEGVYSSDNDVVISTGSLVSLDIPGTYRLIISARSPQIHTFFMSTLGGGAIELSNTGLNTLIITGESEEKKVLLIKRKDGELSVKFETVEEIPSNTIEFQKKLIKEYGSEFKGLRYRCLVVGKAAEHTNMGGIHSVHIRENEIDYGSEGWAGRGGLGSLMLQGHNVAGVIFGGDYEWEKEFEVEPLFEEEFGKSMMDAVYDATKKYRYVLKCGTGGTYGCNFFTEKHRTLWFNWQSLKMKKEVREELYEEKIKNHYLKQFNEEIIEPKSFKTCGEVCPAVCKKVWKKRTKDYEPSTACGPLCGVFDMKQLHDFSGLVDDLGFDAIEIGNTIAYVFEGLSKGVFEPERFNLDDVPVMDPSVTLEDSKKNAKLGMQLLKSMAMGELPVFKNGLRAACKELGEESFAIYVPFGDEGVVSPNMYAVPGFLLPLPIQGKFHTNYCREFNPPRELGSTSAERGVKELYSEELGICRFHRRWSEDLMPKLVKRLGLEEGLYEHCFNLFMKIREYNKKADAEPVYYETKRTKELLRYHLKYYLEDNPPKESAEEWNEKFEEDFEEASEEYWNELKKGISEFIKENKR